MIRENTVVTRAVVPDVPDEGWDDLLDRAVGSGSLHPLEASFARGLPAPRRATFVAGRQALRDALSTVAPVVGATLDAPILRTHRGAPALPSVVTGSVSHKRTLAMAAVAPRGGTLQHIGLDLERRPQADDLRRPSIARKILTGREFEYVQQWGDDTLVGREHVLVHFALKEAVYKAIDPFVERYVRFTEVELEMAGDGRPEVTLLLPEGSVADVRVEAGWQLDGEWIVAWAESHRERRV
ncbi:4'-phosphopantetheinyl transferase superfamily protein [Gemmatimonas sp.]|jgi:enterobactin synthetase component D|uniref:4'-phosphopantetheinyl transferase family protein n=1 Tax=Gemmatimonas sp. TaxID=1962908 RepID=UPI0022C971C9|nr:4'-phosphopantetheinyl transferase superfamily protein [Gemmatimonas sp.]MCZ8204820.1 4'-phosphopantetheinyl transferase superfamily protein [Gemmatimonas sp.]